MGRDRLARSILLLVHQAIAVEAATFLLDILLVTPESLPLVTVDISHLTLQDSEVTPSTDGAGVTKHTALNGRRSVRIRMVAETL